VTQIGDVEEWTVRNVTGEHHVFHIHQTDFLVTESNGERLDIGKMMDTVNVPFARNGRPGEVKLIMPFLEDRIAGRFVYHCHILEHEDGGMMAVAEVLPSVRSAANALAAGFMRVVDRMIERKPSGPQVTARIEQVLDAVQAGSYCRTAPPEPEPAAPDP
jgi:hypothetical protein